MVNCLRRITIDIWYYADSPSKHPSSGTYHDINHQSFTGNDWEEYEKARFDPIKKVEVIAPRRRLKVDEELPMKEQYAEFIKNILE